MISRDHNNFKYFWTYRVPDSPSKINEMVNDYVGFQEGCSEENRSRIIPGCDCETSTTVEVFASEPNSQYLEANKGDFIVIYQDGWAEVLSVKEFTHRFSDDLYSRMTRGVLVW